SAPGRSSRPPASGYPTGARSHARPCPPSAGSSRRLGKLLAHHPVMAKSHRFALDQERQARVERAGPRRLVLAEEPTLLLGIRRGVEATADGHALGKRRLEPPAGPSGGHRPLGPA